MTWLSTFSYLALGLAFGLKHALDADHLAAVATIAVRERSLRRSTLIGGLWGIGHTLALLAAGVAVIGFDLRIGERLARALETGVALMLIGLGLSTLRRLAVGGELALEAHRHGHHTHAHPHIHEAGAMPLSHHRLGLPLRPLMVGLVHGMAGSAALMLLVLAAIESTAGRFAYVAAFGLGSIGGMMLMSALLSLPALLAAGRSRSAHLAVQIAAALCSLGLGCALAWPT